MDLELHWRAGNQKIILKKLNILNPFEIAQDRSEFKGRGKL